LRCAVASRPRNRRSATAGTLHFVQHNKWAASGRTSKNKPNRMTQPPLPSVDPITFEVIKHRPWQINDEQSIAIRTISSLRRQFVAHQRASGNPQRRRNNSPQMR
jgi:hypothetical protein